MGVGSSKQFNAEKKYRVETSSSTKEESGLLRKSSTASERQASAMGAGSSGQSNADNKYGVETSSSRKEELGLLTDASTNVVKEEKIFNFDSSTAHIDTVAEETTEPTCRKVTPTVFKWEGGGEQVFIGGTFNDWKTMPMEKSHEDFFIIMYLPEGEYQFKFLVDGVWRHDPGLKTTVNEMGVTNNYISVKKSDFTVFKALVDKDIKEVNSRTAEPRCLST